MAEVFEYMDRAEWKARPPKSVRRVLPHQFSAIEFHHSATGVSPAAQAARSFQNYHMDTRKWKDLFYNWLIHPDGTVIEGRGWGTSARQENFMTICFIGNYDELEVSDEAKAAAGVLVRECKRRMPQLASKPVQWHNQRDSTSCPGSSLVVFARAGNSVGWPEPVVNAPPPPPPLPVSDEELNGLAAAAYSLSYKANRLANQSDLNLALVRQFRRDNEQ